MAVSHWLAAAAFALALSGPDIVGQGDTATFTASGADSASYAFDLDGDGRFEVDNGTNPTVAKRFDIPGRFNIGVRAIDGQGGRAYADRLLEVQAPPLKQLVERFSLNRPVFGGSTKRKLKVTYRLRETATATLDLHRGDQRVKQLVRSTVHAAGTTYTVMISTKGRRRGTYTVRLRARTAAGRTQSARLAAERL